MILSALPLSPPASVNSFYVLDCAQFTAGNSAVVTFQLIDASVNTSVQGFKPPGLRYMPAAGATLQATVVNLDINKIITRFCTQPYASDSSIWQLQILPTDIIQGTPDLVLLLSEPNGGSTQLTQGRVQQLLSVNPVVTNAVAVPVSLYTVIGE